MLALAGVALQDSLRNALAGPELLGVSAGASMVIAAITIFHIPVLLTVFPFLALAGGMLAGAFVILTMRRLGDPVRLVLMGVAVNALLYAGIISITVLGSQTDVSVLYLFLLGSGQPHLALRAAGRAVGPRRHSAGAAGRAPAQFATIRR